MRAVILDKHGARPSDYFKEVYDYERLQNFTRKVNRVRSSRKEVSEIDAWAWLSSNSSIAGGSGTMSNYLETHLLDHGNARTAFAMPAAIGLALCTAVPDSSKTGATITEANYTGYARASLTLGTSGIFPASTSGGAGVASTCATNAAIPFANCTAGSSVVTGWAMLDSITTGAGNSLWWGSATSTTISTTQTPATIAAGGLTESLL